MLTYYRGMKAVEQAAFAATYKTVWVAGPTIEFSHAIEDVATIAKRIIEECDLAYKALVERQSL